MGATPGPGCRWGSGRLTVGRHGRGPGSALSWRVAAWRVWADGHRGMAGAGRVKHKMSTKEVPPWNRQRGVLLGGGGGGLRRVWRCTGSPLVRMWINLILGSIRLHVINSLHAECVLRLMLSSDDFKSKLTFQKFLQKLSECQMVYIQIRTDVLLVPNWVQTICKWYQGKSGELRE